SPIPVARAEGSTFWDYDGNPYIDTASQFVYLNVGHQHPKVVEALVAQARELCVIAPNLGNETRGRAAEAISGLSPIPDSKVLFTNAGADAVEHAVRLARVKTGRPKVLSSYRSYHGATSTSIALTGDPRRWPSDSGATGVVHFFAPFLYRSHFGST